jgi:quinol monooxygenase YgiN
MAEELVIFARFHAAQGNEAAVETEMREAVSRVLPEPGCTAIAAYRSVRDPRLFWLHSRWTDERAFDVHAELPQTERFLERIGRLIDHALDITRTRQIS